MPQPAEFVVKHLPHIPLPAPRGGMAGKGEGPATPAPPPPAPVPAPAPATSSPPPKSGIPPRYDLNIKWDACLDLSIRRVAYSSLDGTFTGLLPFRKEASYYLPPIAALSPEIWLRTACFGGVLSMDSLCRLLV
jgi:hypothetical protein